MENSQLMQQTTKVASSPWFEEQQVPLLFSSGPSSVHLKVFAVNQPTIAWLNLALAKTDPAFEALGGNVEKYREHVLANCAFRTGDAQNIDHDNSTEAIVDRYGGKGLNGNGGAGRAAFINGYYVKGIGRTQLLGDSEEHSHASGDAYLEEAVREAIFGEIFAAELPHSAIRTLAIIGVGQTVHWASVNKTESLVLIVRQSFLRVGHFSRALLFRSKRERDGALDAMRVKYLFAEAEARATRSGIASWLAKLHVQIAEQMGYCFAHRIAHGSVTLSNLAADGRVLDYGASSTLPTYGRGILAPAGTGVKYANALNGQFDELANVIEYATQAIEGFTFSHEEIANVRAAADVRFKETVAIEILKMLGVDAASYCIAGKDFRNEVENALNAVLLSEQLHKVDLIQSKNLREHMRGPLEILDALPKKVASAIQTLFSRSNRDLNSHKTFFQGRKLVCSPRPDLFRETAKSDIYAQVDPCSAERCPLDTTISEDVVGQTIAKWVASNRRDTKVEIEGTRHVGFAVSNARTLVLFRVQGDHRVHGIDESEYPLKKDYGALVPIEHWIAEDPALQISTHWGEITQRESGDGCHA